MFLPPQRVDGAVTVARPAPVLVLLHGGFWRQEYDRHHVRPLAHALCAEGLVVATPEYARTGGVGGWPHMFDDIAAVRDALPTLLAAVAPGRTQEGPVTVAGHSAGGHLALWWALTAPDPGSVRRVVALAPVADLRRGHAERLGEGAVEALLGGTPEQHPDRYDACDPVRLLAATERATPVTVPVTVLHGTDDGVVPVEHSRDLHGVTFVELPDTEHFALIDPLQPAWPTVRDAILRGQH